MKCSVATVTIQGITPYSQSRMHSAPKLEGESHDDYDARTVLQKLTLHPNGNVAIPAHGMHQALIAAAKYDGGKIAGAGAKTWTAKFTTGLAITEAIDTGLRPEDAVIEPILCNADGVRGSGKRVLRRFPVFHEWDASFDVYILDSIITETQFRKIMELAGMFIGIGRFRPEKGGHNGRFRLATLAWKDNRQLVA